MPSLAMGRSSKAEIREFLLVSIRQHSPRRWHPFWPRLHPSPSNYVLTSSIRLPGLGWPATITLTTLFTTRHLETPMSDLEMPALIQQLQKSNRRWRWLAISLLAVIGLALPLLATSAVVLKVRAEQEAMAAQDAAEQARQQAQKAAEKARQQELQRRFDEQRKAVDEFKNKGRNP